MKNTTIIIWSRDHWGCYQQSRM